MCKVCLLKDASYEEAGPHDMCQGGLWEEPSYEEAGPHDMCKACLQEEGVDQVGILDKVLNAASSFPCLIPNQILQKSWKAGEKGLVTLLWQLHSKCFMKRWWWVCEIYMPTWHSHANMTFRCKLDIQQSRQARSVLEEEGDIFLLLCVEEGVQASHQIWDMDFCRLGPRSSSHCQPTRCQDLWSLKRWLLSQRSIKWTQMSSHQALLGVLVRLLRGYHEVGGSLWWGLLWG